MPKEYRPVDWLWVAAAEAFYQLPRALLLKDFQEKSEEIGTTDAFHGYETPIDRQVIDLTIIFRGRASAWVLWAARSQVSPRPVCAIFLRAQLSDGSALPATQEEHLRCCFSP